MDVATRLAWTAMSYLTSSRVIVRKAIITWRSMISVKRTTENARLTDVLPMRSILYPVLTASTGHPPIFMLSLDCSMGYHELSLVLYLQHYPNDPSSATTTPRFYSHPAQLWVTPGCHPFLSFMRIYIVLNDFLRFP